jgi:hypothetical protein
VRFLAALLAVLAVVGAGAALWYLEPWADEDEPTVDLGDLQGELTGSACRRLAGLAARLAERDRGPLPFLRDFGRQAAGIRPPPRGFGDLARGGRNRIVGRGFLARYDDGSSGQARHFAGIAVATTFVGGANPTRWISEHLRDDPNNSADGRLTDKGIEFATELLRGDMELDQTPGWVLENLCRRT